MHKYKQEDRIIRFHEEDRVLDTIEIELPCLEDWYSKHLGREVTRDEALTMIDGYGIEPKNQLFKRVEIPSKLKDIYVRIYNKYKKERKYTGIADVPEKDIYDEIDNNQLYYKDEIDFIQREWWRRKNGYWCFINGQPTFLNGFFYFFINYWTVDDVDGNDRPDYRRYQKDVAHAFLWADTYTKKYFRHRLYYRVKDKVSFRYFNHKKGLKELYHQLKSKEIPCHFEYGWNSFVDTKTPETPKGIRTCNGLNYVTGRRGAKSSMACCFDYWVITQERSANFFIQAFSEDRAKKYVYSNFILKPFLKLPFFFRPAYKGNDESMSGINFTYEKDELALHRAGVIQPALEGFIKPLPNTEKATDGTKWRVGYIDEPAKKSDEKAGDIDIYTRYTNTIKPATQIGSTVTGTIILATTIGEMNDGGGANFEKLCNESHFYNTNDNGTTQSGLFNLFLAGEVTAPDFMDVYGNSVIEDPETPILLANGTYTSVGSRTWIKNTADEHERNKNWQALTQHLQNYPPSWEDAFSVAPSNDNMPVKEMRDAISDLKAGTPKTKRVHFIWSGEKWKSNPVLSEVETGSWVMSYAPPLHMRNLKANVTEVDGMIKGDKAYPNIYAPDILVANKFFLVVDPVKLHNRNKVGKGGSNAACSVFYKRDYTLDPEEKAREEWMSNDWCFTYNERTDDKREAYEQWLMCAIFLGAHIYPEWPDGEDFTEFVRSKGYDGYMLYNMGYDGKISKRAGVTANAPNINEMITDVITHFKHNAKYCKHIEVLEEWCKFRGPDDLTNRDLCAASGWVFKAMKSLLPQLAEDENSVVELHNILEAFDF